jgi:hypothetical protein
MEKTRVRRTSKDRDESDNKKTAVSVMGSITDLLKWFSRNFSISSGVCNDHIEPPTDNKI